MICVGVDIGTQSLKVVVIEDGRRVRGTANCSLATQHPRPGWVEQDPREWERALSTALPQALEQAGVVAAEVACLGIAGQLDGCLAVGSAGDAQTPCLIWMDRRGTASLADVEIDPDRFREITGQVLDAGHMAAKIRWLKAHESLPKNPRFHQPTSYLVERLTGACVMDHSLASTTMLYNLREGAYDPSLLDIFNVSLEEVPRIANAESIAGSLTAAGAALCRLPMGTPVVVGTGDDFATPLGAGLVQPGPMFCVVGTAEVVGAVSFTADLDREGLVETHPYLGRCLIENPGWHSGGSVVWLRNLLGIGSDREFDALAAQAPIGARGVRFVPALTGAMSPRWNPELRGCFYGLADSHGKAEMARAVLEGCAFAMKDVRTRFTSLGLEGSPIHLLGGGAQSALWAQIRADVCQTQVVRRLHKDACPIGAALLATAAVTTGVTVEEVALSWLDDGCLDVAMPDAGNAEPYADIYQEYCRLFIALEDMVEGDKRNGGS